MSIEAGGSMDQAAAAPLTAREVAVLAFERRWWRHAGAKEEAIRREFAVSPTAYYALLGRLLDNPAALEAEPSLVQGLRQQRAARQRPRGSRTLDLPAGIR
jgi:Protein of unknown function (DUF3263)